MLPLKKQFIFPHIKTGYSDGSGMVTKKHLSLSLVKQKKWAKRRMLLRVGINWQISYKL